MTDSECDEVGAGAEMPLAEGIEGKGQENVMDANEAKRMSKKESRHKDKDASAHPIAGGEDEKRSKSKKKKKSTSDKEKRTKKSERPRPELHDWEVRLYSALPSEVHGILDPSKPVERRIKRTRKWIAERQKTLARRAKKGDNSSTKYLKAKEELSNLMFVLDRLELQQSMTTEGELEISGPHGVERVMALDQNMVWHSKDGLTTEDDLYSETCTDVMSSGMGSPTSSYTHLPSIEEIEERSKRSSVAIRKGSIVKGEGVDTSAAGMFEVDAEPIGKGAYGTVYRGRHVTMMFPVAVKVIDFAEKLSSFRGDTPMHHKMMKEMLDDKQREVEDEMETLKKCQGARLVQYYGCAWPRIGLLWILMELCPFGSVRDLMAAGGVETLREAQAAWVMHCALEGLDQLHSSEPRIIHLDIKGTNLMVAEEGDIKIADFGLARQIGESSSPAKPVQGTRLWMAPELLGATQMVVDGACDIWSLGITLIELLCGNPPHVGEQQMSAVSLIRDGPPPLIERDLKGKKLKPQTVDFLSQCLRKDPRERPSARELLSHPFVHEASSKPFARLIRACQRSKVERKYVSADELVPELSEQSLQRILSADEAGESYPLLTVPRGRDSLNHAPEEEACCTACSIQ